MKKLFFLLLLSVPFLSYKIPDAYRSDEIIFARCTGSVPCNACSNCSACKWCSGGGTCGVCAAPKSNKTTAKPQKKSQEVQSYSSQCQAITKKGSRCSRASRSAGYCWQPWRVKKAAFYEVYQKIDFFKASKSLIVESKVLQVVVIFF